MKKIVIICLLCLVGTVTTSRAITEKKSLAKNPQSLLATFLYLPASLSIHEFGHALTAKVLYGSPIEIHLLPAEIEQSTGRMITIGKPRLAHLLFPAYARIHCPKKQIPSFTDDIKLLTILAAGPLTELLALALYTKILSHYYKGTSQFALKNALYIGINFIPFQTKSMSTDGKKIVDKIKEMIQRSRKTPSIPKQ